ncbi:MAG: sodium:solute symporter family protein [Longimicrobiales bacterium]
MERWQIVTAVVLAYLAITLYIGLATGRKASHDVTGFVAADRQFGLLPMYFVIGGTVFSAFAFLGAPGWAYSRGMAPLYIVSYGVLGMIPWYFIGARASRLGRKRGYVTQAQLVAGRFPSRSLSLLLAVIAIVAFVPYIMLQMSGAGIVFETVTEGHVSFELGAALSYGIVIIYVLFGGATAVGWTNVFQGIIMMAVAWGVGLYIPQQLYGGIGPMFERIADVRPELLTLPGLTAAGEPWTWGGYSTAILSSAIGLMMWPHLFIKAFSARDERILRRSVVLYPTFQIFLIPLLLVGFAGVLFPMAPSQPDNILPHMLLETGLPAIAVGVFCAGALAASMSTGDGLLHAAASIAIEDGIAPFVQVDERRRRRLMQILVFAVGGIAYYLAIVARPNLVYLLLTAYGLVAQLAPPVYAALYWKRATTPAVFAGLFAGSLVAGFFIWQPDLRPYDFHEGILGVAANIVVLVIVSLLTRPQPDAHVEPFVSGTRRNSR